MDVSEVHVISPFIMLRDLFLIFKVQNTTEELFSRNEFNMLLHWIYVAPTMACLMQYVKD